VVCGWDGYSKRVRLIRHRVSQPRPGQPLDFESTIERSLLELREKFDVREIRFDPYQLVAVAQRLTSAGLPMVEFPQSVPNLTESSSNLYELIKSSQSLAVPGCGFTPCRESCGGTGNLPRLAHRQGKGQPQD
jgi:hypothetical protein